MRANGSAPAQLHTIARLRCDAKFGSRGIEPAQRQCAKPRVRVSIGSSRNEGACSPGDRSLWSCGRDGWISPGSRRRRQSGCQSRRGLVPTAFSCCRCKCGRESEWHRWRMRRFPKEQRPQESSCRSHHVFFLVVACCARSNTILPPTRVIIAFVCPICPEGMEKMS